MALLKNISKLLIMKIFANVSLIVFFVLSFTSIEAQETKIDSLENNIKNAKGIKKAMAMKELAGIYEFDSVTYAEKLYLEALTIFENKKNDSLIIRTINRLGPVFLRKNEQNKTFALYQRALANQNINKDKYDKAILFSNIGSFYIKTNHLDSAIFFYKKVIKLLKGTKKLLDLSQSYNNIGVVYYKKADYEKAVDFFIKSLRIKETVLPSGKKVASDQSIIASQINIGLFYYRSESFDNAIKYLSKADKLSSKTNNERYACIAKLNLGILYDKKDKYDIALKYHKAALKLAQKTKQNNLIRKIYNSIANVYINTKNFEKAIIFLNKAIKLTKHPQEKVLSESSLAVAYYETRKLADAEFYAEKTLKTAIEIKNIELQKNLYELLSKINTKKGNYKKAYSNKIKQYNIKDSINSKNNEKLISEIQTKYETEKKEQEIASLTQANKIAELQLEKDRTMRYSLIAIGLLIAVLAVFLFMRNREKAKNNAILKSKNEQLAELNATKDKFFSIVSHDLRTPLSGMKNLTSALAENYKLLDADEIKSYLGNLKNAAEETGNMLNNLLEWAKAQQNLIKVRKHSVKLNSIAKSLIDLHVAKSVEKKIQIDNKIDSNMEINADENILSTIMRNIISNAIKFTPANGKINISANKKIDHTDICIEDTGVGMTNEDIKKLFRIGVDTKSIGKSEEKGAGLGLILSNELMKLIGGNIIVESEIGHGSKFIIAIPQ